MIRCWARQLRPGRTADQNTVPQKETTGSCFLVSQCSRQSGEASKILGQVWGSNTSTENPNRAGFPPRSYLPVHANIDTQAPHTHHVGPRKNHPAHFLSNQLWATTPWWWGRTRPMRPQAKALWPFKRSELKKNKRHPNLLDVHSCGKSDTFRSKRRCKVVPSQCWAGMWKSKHVGPRTKWSLIQRQQ